MKTVITAGKALAPLFALALGACSATSSDTALDEANSLSPAPQSQPAELSEEMRRQQAMLAIRVFYFDFDKSDLKPEARESLTYHAQQLRSSGAKVRLEGHADERGTREYNQALGERRALSVANYLQIQGVPASQIETISYGEEKPVERGTNEAAYAKNRRVEIVY